MVSDACCPMTCQLVSGACGLLTCQAFNPVHGGVHQDTIPFVHCKDTYVCSSDLPTSVQ